jgi:hypothetical protein
MFTVKDQRHVKTPVFADEVTQPYGSASKVESETPFTTVVQSFIRGLGYRMIMFRLGLTSIL